MPQFCLGLPRPLRITRHNLDLFGGNAGGAPVRLLEFESNVLDQKCPHLVAKAVCIETSLFPTQKTVFSPLSTQFPKRGQEGRGGGGTLKVKLFLTFSASTSVTCLSKLFRIFMASWGAMRPSEIRSSRASVRAIPILFFGTRPQPSPSAPPRHTRPATVSLIFKLQTASWEGVREQQQGESYEDRR